MSGTEDLIKPTDVSINEFHYQNVSQLFTLSEKEQALESNWSWLRLYSHIILSRLIRMESHWHHRFQKAVRSPLLDFLMQRLTLIGSTTSFIIMIPFMFLIGGNIGEFAVHFALLMSISVYVTNVFKDLLCLPRPSLPIERIDIIIKHSEEFGFPSCHTFLAIALGRLTLNTLFSNSSDIFSFSTPEWVFVGFLSTIIISRVYCGMHSVTDIVGGLLLGWSTSEIYIRSIPWIENWIHSATPVSSLTSTIGLAFLLVGLIHPDPMWQGCPCFKDSLRVVGVVIGVIVAKVNLHLYPLGALSSAPFPSTLVDVFIRSILSISSLAVFELFVFKQIKWFLEPFFLPPRVHTKGMTFQLDRTSFSVIGEVIKFVGIAFLATDLIPRVIYCFGF